MIYKLVCAGEDSFTLLEKNFSKEEENQTIYIAVDGGFHTLHHLDKKITTYFGDQDSLKEFVSLDVQNDDIVNYPFLLSPHFYPSHKNEGDLELALFWLIHQPFFQKQDQIYIYNATGGRLDHYQVALHLLAFYQNYFIKIVDARNEIFIGQNKEIFLKDEYSYISFFALQESIISLEGFKYPLKNYVLKICDNLCLSNEILDEGILYTNHPLLVMKTK